MKGLSQRKQKIFSESRFLQPESGENEPGLRHLAEEFESFFNRFRSGFRKPGGSVEESVRHYLCGLLQSEKRNMERMVEVVPDSDYERLQYSLSEAEWDEPWLLEELSEEANGLLGGDRDSAMIFDESAHVKSGKCSAGVARQYCGRLGKVENCPVGVYAALCCRQSVVLTDARLYLPQEWVAEVSRCETAGIPEAERIYRSKTQLALEMVRSARQRKSDFRWSGFDAGYGKEPWFLQALDQEGEVFVADIHKDQVIYLQDPAPQEVATTSNRAKKRPNGSVRWPEYGLIAGCKLSPPAPGKSCVCEGVSGGF